MQRLDAYKSKRRFDQTPEPQGGRADTGDTIFVIQKHRASHLHYDLRLQVGDTLRSWAVPEGPCLDPKVRRFAKQVEDHPLDYAWFEGVIPAGQYGAGEVIVWDRGTWVTTADVETALEKGELKFRLAGEKLSGGWMLKRLPNDPTNWLLIKERDIAVRPLAEYDVMVERPGSVLSSKRVAETKPAKLRKGVKPVKVDQIAGARRSEMPAKWKPQLAGHADMPPKGPGWLHEIKFDGYRTLAFLDRGDVRLVTRNGLDWTKRYAPLDKAFLKLRCETAIIDGEIAVQDARGVTVLSDLESALSAGVTHSLTFFAFDLVHLNSHDLSAAKLVDRKRALEALIQPVSDERFPIQFSDHATGNGDDFFSQACELGVEGIVSKQADSKYVQTRSTSWIKIKKVDISEAVVVGFTSSATRAVASIVLADHVDGRLALAGKVGSGISDKLARQLFADMSGRALAKSSFPLSGLKGVTWVEPEWMARIAHRGKTGEGSYRQAALLSVSTRAKPKQRRASLKPRLILDRDLAGIKITSADREVLEGSGVTKLDIALHYARVGDWMLPDLLRRPVTLVRCPSGKRSDIFYQRHAFSGLPTGIDKVELSDEEGRGAFLAVTSVAGFLALPQFGAVEFHPWGCHIDNPEDPDRLVIDLDPDEGLAWTTVCSAAERLKERLASWGFNPMLRTTGGKGVHLVLALAKRHDWPTAKGFAEGFARLMAKEAPHAFTASPSKAHRKGRIYIDYLRNARGATAVGSYSLRLRPGFPVATPIAWSELRQLSGGDAFTIANIGERLESIRHDPWDELVSNPVKITRGLRRDLGMGA